jgi:hypothetical protein
VGVAALAALACASPPRPVTDADLIAGERALDTSYRVKNRFVVIAPAKIEYVLPVGEYRPALADEEGVYYAAPSGIREHAGFSKRSVKGGLYAPWGSEAALARPELYVERPDGRIAKMPLPAAALRAWGKDLGFAVRGRDYEPPR